MALDMVFGDLLDSQIRDELDSDVMESLGMMAHPREAITQSKSLKEDGNRFFEKRTLRQLYLAMGNHYSFFV